MRERRERRRSVDKEARIHYKLDATLATPRPSPSELPLNLRSAWSRSPIKSATMSPSRRALGGMPRHQPDWPGCNPSQIGPLTLIYHLP